MKINTSKLISNVASELESYRSVFWALWQWAARFSGAASPLRFTSETGGRVFGQQSETLDEEAFDPTIKSMLTTAKDYFGGLFFPANEPWEVQTSGKTVSLSPGEAIACTELIRDTLNNPDSKWYEAREIFLDNFTRFGTGDLMGVETLDNDCPFIVRSMGLSAMSTNVDHSAQRQVFNMTAQQIVKEFGWEKVKNIKRVVAAFQNYDISTLFKVSCLIVQNPEYVKGVEDGRKARPYIGYWYLTDDEIFDTEMFREKPFSISRYFIRQGYGYGYSPLTNMKKSFESLEGLFFLSMSSAGKIADARMGYFDLGTVGTLELDSDAKYVPFNGGLVGSGTAPIFKIEDAGDITPIWNAIRPVILEGLRKEYKLDAMEGYFQKSGNPRTATEVMALKTVQDAMLAPQVRLFAEQLTDFRRRITMIALRALVRMGRIKTPGVEKAIMRGDKSIFKLEETSIVKRIIYSERQQQFVNDLQTIGAALQVQNSLIGAVDLYDPLKKVLEYGNIKLRDKTDYEQKRNLAEEMSIRQSQAQTTVAEAAADKAATEAVGQ